MWSQEFERRVFECLFKDQISWTRGNPRKCKGWVHNNHETRHCTLISKVLLEQSWIGLHRWRKFKCWTKKGDEVCVNKGCGEAKVEIPIVEKKAIMASSKAKGKSLPKNQRGSQVKHFCHHCGICGHTIPNFFKLCTLKRSDLQST